jgi:uncharacterized membrane protein
MVDIEPIVSTAAAATELAGAAIIVGGLVAATARAALAASRRGVVPYQSYRRELGYAIVLGLEVLVAADIIRTVAFTPTMGSVLVLAMIVAIRTFLSLSLAVELEGRWPWQRATDADDRPRHPVSAHP